MTEFTPLSPQIAPTDESQTIASTVREHNTRKPPHRILNDDPLLTADDVARRLNVSHDWVWDHSSRKKPYLPVIRMGDGTLRYRSSAIEAFIDERERVSSMRRRVG